MAVILTLCSAVKNAVPVVDLGIGLVFLFGCVFVGVFFWLQQMAIMLK